MNILQLTNDSRNTYGLRHEDYRRYRQFCARKVRSIRQSIGFKQSKGRNFIKREVTSDVVNDIRFLHILLFDAERNWAYAMQLQQESKSADETEAARKRHHLIRKLRKAKGYAMQLQIICENLARLSTQEQVDVDTDVSESNSATKLKIDPRSVLESQAYAATMLGYSLFEEQKWASCLEALVAARIKYQQLSELTAASHEEALAQAAMDAVDPNIRYCVYNLNKAGKGIEGRSAPSDINALVEMVKRTKLSNKEDDIVQSQIQALLSQSVEEKSAKVSLLRFRSRELILKNTIIAEAISKIKDMSTKSVQPSSHVSGKDGILSQYDNIISACLEAEKLARRDLEQDRIANEKIQTSKSEETTKNLQFVYAFVTYWRIVKAIERNLTLVSQLSSKLNTSHAFKDGVVNNEASKPEDIVRLYDNIIQNLIELQHLPAMTEDLPLVKEIDAKISAYRSFRCYYLALAYINQQRFHEAKALFDRSSGYLAQSKMEMKSIHPTSENEDAVPAIPLPPKADIEWLEQSTKGKSAWVHAKWFLHQNQSVNSVSAGKSKPKKSTAIPISSSLYTFQHPVPSFPSDSSIPYVVDLPPKFAPAPAKPVFFDVAFNSLSFPEVVADKTSKEYVTEQELLGKSEIDKKNMSAGLGGWIGSLFGKKSGN